MAETQTRAKEEKDKITLSGNHKLKYLDMFPFEMKREHALRI